MDTGWVGHGWIQGVHGYRMGRTGGYRVSMDTGWVERVDTVWIGQGWIQGGHGYRVGRARVDTGRAKIQGEKDTGGYRVSMDIGWVGHGCIQGG